MPARLHIRIGVGKQKPSSSQHHHVEGFRPTVEVKHELGDRVLSALQRANQLDSANAGRNISSKMLPGNDAEYKELPQLADSSDSV